MIKSFTVSSTIILCLLMIETAILSNISALPVVPDLLLLSTIYFSLVNGRTYGQLSGFASGLLLDFVSGVPLGFNCLYRTIIGYAAGFFCGTLDFTGVFIPCVMGASGTIVKFFLIYIISLFFPAVTMAHGIISIYFLFEFVINIILAPIMFKLFGAFEKLILIRSSELR
ncbi:MAG: rod shape-determining protein MreD [Treponema sp.]